MFKYSPGCYRITTIFSHAQTVVPCAGCSLILCQPGGGKCRLTAGEKNVTKTFIPPGCQNEWIYDQRQGFSHTLRTVLPVM